jgi:hypothetical protein
MLVCVISPTWKLKKIPETISLNLSTLYGVAKVTLSKRDTFGSADTPIPIGYAVYILLNGTDNWKYPAGTINKDVWNYWTKDMQPWEVPYGMLPVSPYGDILTVKVKSGLEYNNQITTATCKVMGVKNEKAK